MVIQGVSYNVVEVGKFVKKSKRRFTWNFLVDGDGYIVEMIASHISRKKRVLLNHEIIYEATKLKERKETNSAFKFTFQIGVNICTIVQKGEHFDLRINNKTFQELCENRGSEFIFEAKKKAPSRNQAAEPEHTTQVASTIKKDENLPAFSGTTVFKDELGDLTGLRGVRTKNLQAANNTNSATLKENKPSQANVMHTEPAVVKEQKPPAESHFFKQKNKEVKEVKEVPKLQPPPVQEKIPAETNIAPPETQPKAPKDQNGHKPTLKDKLGNVATGLKNAITGHKETSDAENPKPKENKSDNDKATSQSSTTKEQPAPPVVHTMPTLADIMKEEIGDLSGIRGVRTKKNPYTENEPSSAKETKTYNAPVSAPKQNKREVEEKKEEVYPSQRHSMPTSLVEVMKDELGDLSGIRGTRAKNVAPEPTYTPHYTMPPVTEEYAEESTYGRDYYSPPKQDYSAQQDYSAPQQRYSPQKQEYSEPQYTQPEYNRQSEYRQQEYRQPVNPQQEYREQVYPQQSYNISPQKPVVQKQQQQQQQFANSNPFANPAASTQASSSTQNIFDQFGFNNNTQQQNAFKQDAFASFNAFNAKPNNNSNFGAQSVNNFGTAAPQFNQMAASIPVQTVAKQAVQNYPNQFNTQAPKPMPNATPSFNAPAAGNKNANDNFDWDYSGFGGNNNRASQSTGNMGGFNNMGFNNANTGFNAGGNFNAGFNNFNQNNFANNNRNYYQNNSQNLVQDLL